MTISHSSERDSRCFSSLAAIATIICLTGSPLHAQQAFQTPEDAAGALASAVKSGAKSEMLKVLGKGGKDIVDSGDAVADAAAREKFTTAYDTKHSVSREGDKKAVMIVGSNDFPFPVPIIRTKSGWEFDTDAGRREILYRRIGRNELDAIQTCLAYVDAQDDYANKDHTGAGPGVYAQRIVSNPGLEDGLYWPSSDGNKSPLGELMAAASAQGYKTESGPRPYHGYYYRILTRQGPHAAGGELNYVVNGKMIGGFALVAYPAVYDNSGVMTFLVNYAGTVYQKDLGPDTSELAKRMTSFDPDRSWKKVDTTSQ
jgi:Protein of unknown function (DUF2950)